MKNSDTPSSEQLRETPASEKTSAAKKPRRWLRWGLAALVTVLAVLAGLGLYFHSRLEASLPTLDGAVASEGLSAAATIERDALGVVSIRGENRLDVAQALGYAHAQDRFFQMEFYRRTAAGELSAMVGSSMFEQDLAMRGHRFREAAAVMVENSPAEEVALLEAYSRGVNQGLASLGDKPYELIVLGIDPAPWTPIDSVLVAYYTFEGLQDPLDPYESTMGLLHDLLPSDLAEFLAPFGTTWDAPVVGEELDVAGIPSSQVVDLRASGETRIAQASLADLEQPLADRKMSGSNNWAVGGQRTASGAALVANDMHQSLNVPNIWYRVSMFRPDGANGPVEMHGATIPGLPSLIIGSNTHIAWGYTVSNHDSKDLILVEPVEGQPDHYLTPEGPRPFEKVVEKIDVKGSGTVEREVLHTIWGPVIDEDHRGRQRALRWVGHEADAVNFIIRELEETTTAGEALEIAKRIGAPSQNFVVGDSSGTIGWTILGRVPRRVGLDGRQPSSWAAGDRGWQGWLTSEEVPTVLAPESGLLWSANARVAEEAALERVGDGGYDLGARASQIRDSLEALEQATPADMLAIQLDDRAVFLERWRDLLLEVMTPELVGERPDRAEFLRIIRDDWDGHASVDSVSFRLVRTFRLLLSELIFGAVAAPVYEADEDFRYYIRVPQMEGPLWALVSERPQHLLPAGFDDWATLFGEGVDRTTGYLGDNFANATWGQRNSVQPHHLFSRVLPPLRPWLDPQRVQLPGDVNMPRLQNPFLGSSQRMVVAPGHEEEAFFHMPGGQSGHPLSPYYHAGYDAWVEGTPTPLLPGPPVHTLTLEPVR